MPAHPKPGLTHAQWQRIFRRVNEDPDVDLKQLVDAAVRERMAVAYERGEKNGWEAGVSDAMDDEPIERKPNPYRT